MESIQDRADGLFSGFAERCGHLYDVRGMDEIRRAYGYAVQTLGTARFASGESILVHAVEVACVVAEEIGLGSESVVVAVPGTRSRPPQAASSAARATRRLTATPGSPT